MSQRPGARTRLDQAHPGRLIAVFPLRNGQTGRVAQPDRASAFEAEGCRFEHGYTHSARLIMRATRRVPGSKMTTLSSGETK